MTSYLSGGRARRHLLLLQRLVGRAVDETEIRVDPRTCVMMRWWRRFDVTHPESAFANNGAAQLNSQQVTRDPAVSACRLWRTWSCYLECRLLLAAAVLPLRCRIALVHLLANLRQVLGAWELNFISAWLQSFHCIQVYTSKPRLSTSFCTWQLQFWHINTSSNTDHNDEWWLVHYSYIRATSDSAVFLENSSKTHYFSLAFNVYWFPFCCFTVFTCVSYAEARNRYRLDVCPSVRLSVTRWHLIKTA